MSIKLICSDIPGTLKLHGRMWGCTALLEELR